MPGSLRRGRSPLAAQSFYSVEQGKGNCPLPLQPHPQNQPNPIGEGTTLKPDISLATKSGHFNLLPTEHETSGSTGLLHSFRRARFERRRLQPVKMRASASEGRYVL